MPNVGLKPNKANQAIEQIVGAVAGGKISLSRRTSNILM